MTVPRFELFSRNSQKKPPTYLQTPLGLTFSQLGDAVGPFLAQISLIWAPLGLYLEHLGALRRPKNSKDKNKRRSRDALGPLSVHFLAHFSMLGRSGDALGPFWDDFCSISEPPGRDSEFLFD